MNREDIILMAREVGLPHWYETNTLVNESLVLKFASLVADAEREECAKVCDEEGLLWGRRYAAAIRARGEQK